MTTTPHRIDDWKAKRKPFDVPRVTITAEDVRRARLDYEAEQRVSRRMLIAAVACFLTGLCLIGLVIA